MFETKSQPVPVFVTIDRQECEDNLHRAKLPSCANAWWEVVESDIEESEMSLLTPKSGESSMISSTDSKPKKYTLFRQGCAGEKRDGAVKSRFCQECSDKYNNA